MEMCAVAGSLRRNSDKVRGKAPPEGEQGQQRMVHQGADEDRAEVEQVGDLREIVSENGHTFIRPILFFVYL